LDKQSLYLIITLWVANGINLLLKRFFFKPLMRDNNFPIIGKGTRPKGAKDCGLFKNDPYCCGYGMPSGHSQSAATFATFLILKTESSYYSKVIKLIIESSLILMILLIMYSRVYFGCHTIQKTIIGSLLGIISGFYIWKNRAIVHYFN